MLGIRSLTRSTTKKAPYGMSDRGAYCDTTVRSLVVPSDNVSQQELTQPWKPSVRKGQSLGYLGIAAERLVLGGEQQWLKVVVEVAQHLVCSGRLLDAKARFELVYLLHDVDEAFRRLAVQNRNQ